MYSDTDIASAKDSMCEAYQSVSRATDAAGGQTSDDQLTKFAIAINIRNTAALSADYIFRKLEENPATPPALSDLLYELASTYQEMLLLQIGDATERELDAIYEKVNNLDSPIDRECQ